MGSRQPSIRLVHILLSGLVVLTQAGCSNVYKSALEGSRKGAKAAIQRGDDINGTYTSNARTPLHAAADRGHPKMTIFLCEENADPNLRDDQGNTPLHLAVRRGHYKTVSILLASGADLLIRNNNGKTPRDMAAGHSKMAEMLRNAGG